MYTFNKGIGKAKEDSRNIELHYNIPVKMLLCNTSREKTIKCHPSVPGWVDENGRLESRWFWREQLILKEFAYIYESIYSPAQAD